jgi:hypothetical protein
MTSYTYKHDNVGIIIAQAINNHNPQNIIKAENGNLLNWNQELRLPAEIRSHKENIDVMAVPIEEKKR